MQQKRHPQKTVDRVALLYGVLLGVAASTAAVAAFGGPNSARRKTAMTRNWGKISVSLSAMANGDTAADDADAPGVINKFSRYVRWTD